MEFKYLAGQNQRTPSPAPCPLSAISGHSLQGSEFVPNDYPGNISVPRVFPTLVPVNSGEAFQRALEKEQIQREKEEIRRQIITGEMALSGRQELEEEVRRGMAAERALGIPVQRQEGISFQPRVSRSSNPRMRINNPITNIKLFGGPQPHLPRQVDIEQFTQLPTTIAHNKDKVIILAKPDADHYRAKRKAMTPLSIDDNENSHVNLEKKPKHEWRCTLCQINTTSEKGLNDHLLGKKHKAKEASQRTKKISKSTKTSLSLQKSKKVCEI